jgi:hypothetical protein
MVMVKVCVKGAVMESRIHQTMWGSQTESAYARELGQQDPFQILSERIQQALSAELPTPHVRSISVTRERRVVDELLCEGYCITVALSVKQAPDSPEAARMLECRMEALMSVALLDLLTPVHVDFVATLHDADN